MFQNRKEAGKKLAEAFSKYQNKGVVVLAIPNGGVEIGCEVSKYLHAEFALAFSLKLSYPDDPHSSFGSIAEDGSTHIHSHAYRWFNDEKINDIIRERKQEIQRKISVLRKGQSLPKIKNRTVIIIDEGLTKGATVQSVIKMCRHFNASKILLGVPVSSREACDSIARQVDKIVVLEKPLTFKSVAQVYREWKPLSEDEVLEILERFSCKDNASGESRREVA